MEYFKQPLTPAILEKEQPPRYCAMKQSSQSYPAVGSGRFCLQSFLVSACSFGAEIESKEIGSSLKKKNIYPVISVDKILTHTLKFPKRYLPASMIFFLVMAARALGQDIYDLFSKPAPSRVNRYQVKGVWLEQGWGMAPPDSRWEVSRLPKAQPGIADLYFNHWGIGCWAPKSMDLYLISFRLAFWWERRVSFKRQQLVFGNLQNLQVWLQQPFLTSNEQGNQPWSVHSFPCCVSLVS